MDFEQQLLEENAEDTQHGRFLTFDLGEEDFGVEIKYVTEIIGLQPITNIPEVPDYIKGIINLRGLIIPVVDMRIKFKKEPIEYTSRTCIVVIETDGVRAGLIVDQVAEVLSINDEDIALPPNARTGIHNTYIKGIGKVDEQVKLLLDCEELFSDNEAETLSQIKGEK